MPYAPTKNLPRETRRNPRTGGTRIPASAVVQDKPQPGAPISLKMLEQSYQLSEVNQRLETATPLEIVRWAVETYGSKLTMATAFGAEGCCLLSMIAQVRNETGLMPDVFNLDTGYQFQETLQLRDEIHEKYGVFVRLVSAEETVARMEARNGGPLYVTAPDLCCQMRKVVPLQQAVQGFDAWITAIRREQTPERAHSPIVGPDPRHGHLTKINPLANWSKADVWNYVERNGVPVNALHAQGYPSIGCKPCTRAVASGEDDRAGRWAGTGKRECGIHLSK
jgi:phosphoadenosine phosphosulfate reductase